MVERPQTLTSEPREIGDLLGDAATEKVADFVGVDELSNRIIGGHCRVLVVGGEGGIRTHGRGNPDTRSPGVPVRPLQHLSAERVGFEPTLRYNRRPLFASGTIIHSVTSPIGLLYHL